MGAREYLQQLQRLDTIIAQKTLEKADLRAALSDVSSVDLSRERVQGGKLPADSGLYDRVVKLVSLEDEIDERIKAFADLKHTIIEQIHGLYDVRYIKLLYKRYVEFKDFEKISREMHYTYQYTKELHSDALQSFETTYPNLPATVL